MSDKTPEIYWSEDGETFSYDSVHELLQVHSNMSAGEVVHFGEAYRPDPAGWVDQEDVIDLLMERAYDDCGEHAENYMDGTSKAARDELDELLAGWFRKHAQPEFWKIKNTKQYVLTQADIDEANGEATTK